MLHLLLNQMQDSTEMANLIQTNESTANETDFLNLPTRSIPYDSVESIYK